MITVLKEFGRGQVTLPKKWREKFGTNVYIGKETSQGFLIVPLQDQTVKVDEKKLKKEAPNKATSNFFKRKSIRKS